MSTTINETYTLAHTAQCKLKLAANRPDRNLRFLIGHAFTYDKLMLKIVEIEERGMRDPVQELPKTSQPRRISFGAAKEPEKVSKAAGRRSPPPPQRMTEAQVHGGDDGSDSEKTDSDDEVFDDHNDEEEGGLGLSKTTSRIAQPPSQRQPEPELEPEPEPEHHPTHLNQFDEESSSSSEEEYERSPLTPPSDEDLAVMMKDADGDEALADLYESVRNCSCHGVPSDKAPKIERAWEVPQKEEGMGMGGPRVAVVQVAA